MEGQFCRCTQQALDLFRVVSARDLDENTLSALLLDCEFLGAIRIKTQAYDFQGLLDYICTSFHDGLFGNLNAQSARS